MHMYSRHSDPCLRHSSCIYCCITYTPLKHIVGLRASLRENLRWLYRYRGFA